MAEDKFWQRRESRNMKVAKKSTDIVEAMAQLSRGAAADGPTRMKIVVKKEEVDQLMEAVRGVRRGTAVAMSPLEQRLNLLRRRQILARVKGRSRLGSWRPVLQSIPE